MRRLIAIRRCFSAESDCNVVFRRIMIPISIALQPFLSIFLGWATFLRKIPSCASLASSKSIVLELFVFSDRWAMFSFVSLAEAHVSRGVEGDGMRGKFRNWPRNANFRPAIIEGSTFCQPRESRRCYFRGVLLWAGHTI